MKDCSGIRTYPDSAGFPNFFRDLSNIFNNANNLEKTNEIWKKVHQYTII